MWKGLLVALAVLGLLGLKSNNPAPSSDEGGLGDVAAAVDVTDAAGGAPAAASKSTLPDDEMAALDGEHAAGGAPAAASKSTLPDGEMAAFDGEHTTSGKKPFDAVAAAAAAAQKRRRERPSRRRFYDDDADDDDDDAAGRWRRKVDGGAPPSDDVPKWIPADWAKQLFSSAASGAKKKTNEEFSAAATAAEKAAVPAELESDDTIAQREAREYERAVRQEWLFARAVGAAQDAWKRLTPKVEVRRTAFPRGRAVRGGRMPCGDCLPKPPPPPPPPPISPLTTSHEFLGRFQVPGSKACSKALWQNVLVKRSATGGVV